MLSFVCINIHPDSVDIFIYMCSFGFGNSLILYGASGCIYYMMRSSPDKQHSAHLSHVTTIGKLYQLNCVIVFARREAVGETVCGGDALGELQECRMYVTSLTA